MSPPNSISGAIAKLDKYHHEQRDSVEEDGATPLLEDEPAAGDTAKVLEAISIYQTTLTSKIEVVKVNVSLIR